MARFIIDRLAAVGAVGLLVSGVFFSACSSDTNNEPGTEAGTGAKTGSGGKGGSGNTSGGGKAGSGNTTNNGGSGNSGTVDGGGGTGGGGAGDSSTETGGTSGGDGGAAGSSSGTGGSDAGVCTQDPKQTCGTCPAASTTEFLNHCTDAKCTGFDNSKLAKLVNGKLPDLP